MYMYSEIPIERTEYIHCPEITTVASVGSKGSLWVVHGDYYGSLYGYNQRAIQAQVSSYYDFSVVEKEYETIVPDPRDPDEPVDTLTSIEITEDAGKYVRIRYTDVNNVSSRWSVPVIIGQYGELK